MCDDSHSQSPFGRSWPSEFLAPCMPQYETSTKEKRKKSEYQHDHQILIRALSISSIKIKSLVMPRESKNGVPIQSFNMRTFIAEYMPMARYTLDVYCNLKILHMVLAAPLPSDQWVFEGLKCCLAQITDLASLYLEVRDQEDPLTVGWASFDAIVPELI